MKIRKIYRYSLLALLVCAAAGMGLNSAAARPQAQMPTGSIATVTSTPISAIAIVLDNEQGFSNVRAGPSTIGYDIVGVLVPKQSVPALGRSPGGDWIQIVYPGVPSGVAWIYAYNVRVEGNLPVVELPATVTPAVTPTIDPTLAAQFLVDIPPTRLPTYTPPPPLAIPTFEAPSVSPITGNIPMGMVIAALLVIGVFGTLLSFLRGR